jgi:pilus assembly protein Flp/PilA
MLTSLIYFQTLISIVSRRVARSEEGASMVEYALLLALVAVVCLGAVTLIGTSANDKFTSIANEISK